MGRGFLSGIVNGSIVAAFVAALLSLFAPLPPVEVQAVVTEVVGAAAEQEQRKAEELAEAEEEAAEQAEEAEADANSAPAPDSAPDNSPENTPNDTDGAASEADQAAPDAPAEAETETADDVAVNADSADSVVATSQIVAPLAVPTPSATREIEIQDSSATPAPPATSSATLGAQDNTATPDIALPDNAISRPVIADGDPTKPAANEGSASSEGLIAQTTPVGIDQQTTALTTPTRTPQIVPAADTTTAPAVIDDAASSVDLELAQAEPAGDAVRKQRLPQITAEPEISADAAPTPDADQTETPEPPANDSDPGRLPTISGDVAVDPETADPDTGAETSSDSDGPISALSTFATPFEMATDLPKVAVIVIAEGAAVQATSSLDFPISVAVSTIAGDSKALIADLRGAQADVLIMPDDLPAAGTPSDVSVAMEAYFTSYEGSIGFIDPLDQRIQQNRGLLSSVLGELKAGGQAFVTYEQGLDTAGQAAARQGVPAASIYRVLDLEKEGGARVMRYLDRAGFEANQRGEVVILSHDYPETIQAISEWASEHAAEYEFVPISALLLGREAG